MEVSNDHPEPEGLSNSTTWRLFTWLLLSLFYGGYASLLYLLAHDGYMAITSVSMHGFRMDGCIAWRGVA